MRNPDTIELTPREKEQYWRGARNAAIVFSVLWALSLLFLNYIHTLIVSHP